MLKVDENGVPEELLAESADASTLDLTDENANWTAVGTFDTDTNAIDLAGIDSDTTLLTPDGEQIAATINYTEATEDAPKTYNVQAGDGLGSDAVVITLGDDNAALETDFGAVVMTPDSGSGEYSVNSTPFKAAESALTIEATPDGVALEAGTVALNSDVTTVATTGEDTVSIPDGDTDTAITVTVEAQNADPEDTDSEMVGKVTAIGGIDEVGESFTLGEDNTYTLSEAGLVNNGKLLNDGVLADDGTVTVENLLDTDTNWSVMIALDDDSDVDLAELTDTSAVIVDSLEAPTARYGTAAIETSEDEEGNSTTSYTVEINDEALATHSTA